MVDQFSRLELLYNEKQMNTLKNSKVIVFGVGGVGGYCIEALVRGGIGSIDIVDNDIVSITNINRQIIASHNTIGKDKVEVMKERMISINPNCHINTYKMFYLKENKELIELSGYDYIVDAIDTISAKLTLIEEANIYNIPIISCMGTGNKYDPTRFEVDDIFNTSVCPLCKVIRRELRKRNIDHLKVVYSKEEPVKPNESKEVTNKRAVPGSTSFTPPVAGMILASQVINDLVGDYNV